MSEREVILDELVVRFDGTVAELWLAGRSSERLHVAQIVKAELRDLDSRRGPTLNIEGTNRGGIALNHLKVAEHQLAALQAIVGEIDAAARGGG
jgi:hypothetical protein